MPATILAHIFVAKNTRLGAAPCVAGTGWEVDCWYGIPDGSAIHLLTAEVFADANPPSFSFHADYLDWPAGVVTESPDTAFQTIGDFFDGYVSNFTDPAALDLPFAHFLIRARNGCHIRLEDSSDPNLSQALVDFGTLAFDGSRVRLGGVTIFRTVIPEPPFGQFTENALIDAPGVYPLVVTYFQRYDPMATLGTEKAGFEFYACHVDGLALCDGMGNCNGDFLPCLAPVDGRVTAISRIYDPADVVAMTPGDFNVDHDVDLRDLMALQNCFTGPAPEKGIDFLCEDLDTDADDDLDGNDWLTIEASAGGPMDCFGY